MEDGVLLNEWSMEDGVLLKNLFENTLLNYSLNCEIYLRWWFFLIHKSRTTLSNLSLNCKISKIIVSSGLWENWGVFDLEPRTCFGEK